MTGRLIAVANGRSVADIARDARGQLSFAYDAAWREDDRAYPQSLSMPLTAAGHDHDRIEPWLWGLLPDNEIPASPGTARTSTSACSSPVP